MGFSSIADVTTAIDNGQFWTQHYFKPSMPTTAGDITDLSWSSGTPSYNSYAAAPLTLVPVVNTNNKYVFTGPTPPAGQQKYLLSWMMRHSKTTAGAGSTFALVDTVGFYTTIDGDSVDLQEMDNTATLPRYTSGEGVRIAVFASLTTLTASTRAEIVYTNQSGGISTVTTAIRGNATSKSLTFGSQAISVNNFAFFMSLAQGDTGVRNIVSIQLENGIGGLLYFALVRPIAFMPISIGAVSEKRFLTDNAINMPEIPNGAGLTVYSYDFTQSAGPPVQGEFYFVWG